MSTYDTNENDKGDGDYDTDDDCGSDYKWRKCMTLSSTNEYL